MVRIAAASTDGKLVNQHFGRADTFYILDTDEETSEYGLAEIRTVVPVCDRGDHDGNRMRESASKFADCDIILVEKIGGRARNELENMGIEVFEIPGIIEESVDKLVRYRKVQDLFKA